MAKEWARPFYNSSSWIKCRDSYIAQRFTTDGGMCEVCGEELGYILHHKIILTPDNINDPNVSLNYDNLRYECKKCHDEEEEHFVKRIKLVVEFDENGMPIRKI